MNTVIAVWLPVKHVSYLPQNTRNTCVTYAPFITITILTIMSLPKKLLHSNWYLTLLHFMVRLKTHLRTELPFQHTNNLSHVKLQTFAVVHNVALMFFMGDYPASG
jgi:hypothetical protein